MKWAFRNYIKIGRWSDIRCFLLIWKSIWVFFLRLEGCLLSDHLPPNKPNFHLISDHLLHFQISDIRPEDCLNTLLYLISDLKSSTSANIWYQTGRLSEYFKILRILKILYQDNKLCRLCFCCHEQEVCRECELCLTLSNTDQLHFSWNNIEIHAHKICSQDLAQDFLGTWNLCRCIFLAQL